MSAKTFSLIGERCSGTNWLHQLITKNFDIKETRYPGFKHWPDYRKPRPRNHVTIFLIRNALDWLRSFYKSPHYVRRQRARNMYAFMYKIPFLSMRSASEIVKQDKNLETGKPYKNLWDMRLSKHLYWLKRSENFELYELDSGFVGTTSNTDLLKDKQAVDSGTFTKGKTVDLWVRYEDVLADPEQFLNFLSKRMKSKNIGSYDILPKTYKTKIDIHFNQSAHKDQQLFSNAKESAIWIKKNITTPIGILVLTTLIDSEIEKRMGYSAFYNQVLKELNELVATQELRV